MGKTIGDKMIKGIRISAGIKQNAGIKGKAKRNRR